VAHRPADGPYLCIYQGNVMQTAEQTTVVGVFDDRTHAEQAVQALHRAGFSEKQIGLLVRHAEAVPTGAETVADRDIGTGLIAGTLLGGLLGAVVTGLIPGVGPVIAAGVMAGILGGGSLGAVAGSLVGLLLALGVPEEHAVLYDKEFKAGRTLVTVQAGERGADVFAIFGRFHAYDVAAAYCSATQDAVAVR
jgi:hypothetical protein